jgi:hypothetical protein
MKILVSGSTGLIGTRLVSLLQERRRRVVRLVRSRSPAFRRQILWDPAAGRIAGGRIEGFDAVVHLSGESVAARWTRERKRAIRESRVGSTRLLAGALAGLEKPPAVMVCASAIGFYGDRGDEILTEESGPGSGFLPEVCTAWEAATEPAVRAGIRVVNLRIGVVLTPEGGALSRMLTPFRLGLGGVAGSGRQYMSWITLEDVARAIDHAIVNESLSGPVNGTAPEPVTNRVFTRTLGRILSRPTLLPMPAFLVRLAFGEMGDALLLSSARVEPARLLASHFRFRHPNLESALRRLLGG